MEGIIYKYTSPSGKVYIGRTFDEAKRRSAFKNKSKYAGSKINKAKKKYGPGNFKYEIIVRIEEDNKDFLDILLNRLERMYIKKYNSFNNGYNLTLGGDRSTLGYKHTEESKKKISEIHKGKKMSDETKLRIKEKMNGRKFSEDTINKMRIAQYGEKSSVAKPILQYTLDGVFIQEWISAMEVCRNIKINYTGILKCCNNKQNTCGNFIWKFK